MELDKVKIYKTVFTLILGLLGFSYFQKSTTYLYSAGILLIIVLLAPSLFKYPMDILEFISPYLSKTISTPLIFISFFLIIIPISLFRKIYKKDGIDNNLFDKKNSSNFIEEKRQYLAEHLIHPF
jgi:hypothetical protein